MPFGGRALSGPAGGAKALPDPLAAIRGLLLRGGEGERGKGKGREGRGGRRGKGRDGREGMPIGPQLKTPSAAYARVTYVVQYL